MEIPTDIQWLLSLGPKFSLPIASTEFPLFKLIADGEDCIQTIQDKEQQEIERNNLTTLIRDHLRKPKSSVRDKFVLDTLHSTKKFLKDNKNVLVLNADKGNVTVLMYKDEYEKKLQQMVNDISTYRVLKRDPTNKLQEKNNEIVEKLFKHKMIDTRGKYQLITKTAIAPRLYGLPKIHKEGLPLRPICSSVNSPSYKLCKYVVNVLENITKTSKYNVKDTIAFKNKIKDTYIFDDESLVSFDVVSLFPSIPVDHALEIIASKWDDIKNHTNLTKELFMNMVRFCIRDNRYFSFNNKIYEQRSGMPMGSPASPVIADIVMEDLLQKFEEDSHHKPRLLTKYVDDLFAIVKTDAVEDMLNILNGYNRSIKFTVEVETDGQLSFLDTLIIRRNNLLSFDWYKKPTASGRLINYNSNHDKATIVNTAKNFVRRVLSISDEVYHEENIKAIKNILENNEFPTHIIQSYIRDYFVKLNTNKPTNDTKKMYKSTTFVSGLSNRIKYSNIYDREKFKLAFTYNNTLQRRIFSNTKSRIEKFDKSDVIYKINCNGDGSHVCDKVYVGTTKSKLKTRISGHKSNIKNRDNPNDNKTALTQHCRTTGHSPDLENVTIMQHERNSNKRYILEMLHIINTPSDKRINFKSDTDHCAYAYRELINNNKKGL
ncbi:uncharacterized protein [Eurosta solidaginis]|uniref:uncharacterized protein n=1 Tax=Eurosta solidaginis TaxID=178769 RepID=UPI003531038C